MFNFLVFAAFFIACGDKEADSAQEPAEDTAAE